MSARPLLSTWPETFIQNVFQMVKTYDHPTTLKPPNDEDVHICVARRQLQRIDAALVAWMSTPALLLQRATHCKFNPSLLWGALTNKLLKTWTGLTNHDNDKTGQAMIRMNRRAVLKRWWTSLHGESVQQYLGEFGFIFITFLTNKKCRKTCQNCVWRRRQIRKKYWISVLVPKSVWYGAQRVINCFYYF